MIELPEKCPRNLSPDVCRPLSQILADDKSSFICCGHSHRDFRKIKDDRFRLCWKNDEIDEMSDWDERDIKDTMSVMAQALSVDANMKLEKPNNPCNLDRNR